MDALIDEYNILCKFLKSEQRKHEKLECIKRMFDLGQFHHGGAPSKPATDTNGDVAAYLAIWDAILCGGGPLAHQPSINDFKYVCRLTTHSSQLLQEYALHVVKAQLRHWPQLASTSAPTGASTLVLNELRTASLNAPLTADIVYAGLVGQCVGGCITFPHTGTAGQTPADYGQCGNDARMAREAFIAFSQNKGRLDPLVYALRMAYCMRCRTSNAAVAIRNGIPADLSGSVTSTTNASAARSAPIGWLHRWIDIPGKSRVFSAITHASPRCKDGAMLIALSAHYAASTRRYPFDPRHFVNAVSAATWQSDFTTYLDALLDRYEAKMFAPGVLDWVIEQGLAYGEDAGPDGTLSDGVLQSTLWAVYCFMRFPDDFAACINLASRAGVVATTHTIAAMAGALCGSRVGIDGIPQAWIDPLHDQGDWGPSKLRGVVDACIRK